nr:multicopper oxidase domain-containing protein [Nocardioides panaciterrulae]
MRDLPALGWLLAVLGVALAHPVVPAPRWLMIHLLLLGAATHSILVWSQYFAEALLHTRATEAAVRAQDRRLVLLNLGALLVVAGVVSAHWPVTIIGATAVVTAVAWHGAALLRRLHRALGSRFAVTVHYYLAATSLLPVGALLGVLLAHGPGEEWHARLMLAHTAVNVLGWLGLTVLGTLVTLWPTMLRTRIAEGAERATRRALPVLVLGVVVTAGAALLGLRPLVPVGLAGFLAGLGVLAVPFVDAARRKPPAGFATWSVLAAVSWLAGSLAFLTVATATSDSWGALHERLGWTTPALAAGFAAQVLLGALSYLVPVALGGGPTPVRAASAELDRGWPLRIVVTNAGLLLCFLPVPPVVRVASSALALAALASFVPLLLRGLRASRRQRDTPATERPPTGQPSRPRGQVGGLAVTGLAATLLAVATGVAVDPSALGRAGLPASAAAGVAPTGHTTHVVVRAADMRFTPDSLDVPAGDRLEIEVRNTDDSDVHDLVLDSGQDSGRLLPGESARVVVPVVGRDVAGWCSVLGHRQMGMVLAVHVRGQQRAPDRAVPAMPGMPASAPSDGGPPADGRGDARMDPNADPGPGFRAHDAALAPLGPGRVHRRTLRISDVVTPVAAGVTQRLWTYGGSAPGPVLHGRVGDRFVITLVNDASIGHSIDFHAGSVAPDAAMRTIPPGGRLVYRFTAHRSGIWLYHCATMPMSAHIANGLFGAVVIDPPGLDPVDRSYLLVQSELYLGPQGRELDLGKLAAEEPDAVVFNGYADQYDHDPLRASVGDRVRFWVLDAGPDRPSYFHVVGGQFDTVFREGAYALRRGNAEHGGSQVLDLGPAQGGFVELTFHRPGHYPFVSHLMTDAERGGHGVVEVSRRAASAARPGGPPAGSPSAR